MWGDVLEDILAGREAGHEAVQLPSSEAQMVMPSRKKSNQPFCVSPSSRFLANPW